MKKTGDNITGLTIQGEDPPSEALTVHRLHIWPFFVLAICCLLGGFCIGVWKGSSNNESEIINAYYYGYSDGHRSALDSLTRDTGMDPFAYRPTTGDLE